MKTKIIILLALLSVLFMSGCGLSENQCKAVAMNQIDGWCETRYNQGIAKGMDYCEASYKPMLKQYEVSKGCVMVLYEEGTMNIYCKDRNWSSDKYNQVMEIR